MAAPQPFRCQRVYIHEGEVSDCTLVMIRVFPYTAVGKFPMFAITRFA